MTFLPATLILWRRSPPLLSSSIHLCQRRLNSSHSVASHVSFDELGLNRSVVAALQEAFPNVQHPTNIQRQFIPALLQGRDILLKDRTGSGKSFGLLLALLSLPRKYTRVNVEGKYVKVPATSSLVITPHRDLVYQFTHWIKSIIGATLYTSDIETIVQVLLRGADSPVAKQVQGLRAKPPHIVIGTPQAILEGLQLENDPLPLQHLSTVVVDEADSLIEYLPRMTDKYERLKYERQLKRHPAPTRQILNYIYPVSHAPTNTDKKTEFWKNQHVHPGKTRSPVQQRPQLVMSSATLKSAFRTAVMANGGWFSSAEHRVSIITPSAGPEDDVESVRSVFGGSKLVHSALVAYDDGRIENVASAVEGPADAEDINEREEQRVNNSDEVPSEGSSMPVVSEDEQKMFADSRSPFHATALEAIAATFALEVPRVALLVLPASASVRRAVYELRNLGVNAHGLDVHDAESGGSFLLRKGIAPAENPTLLVSTMATTRGMDLPDLTHVFLLGVADTLTPGEYLHVAGRVGRFGKGGKVIAILEERRELKLKNGKTTITDEARTMTNLYKKLHVTPVKIELS